MKLQRASWSKSSASVKVLTFHRQLGSYNFSLAGWVILGFMVQLTRNREGEREKGSLENIAVERKEPLLWGVIILSCV